MFPLKSFFNGANYTHGITLTAVHPVLTDGTNLYAGSFITLTPTGATNPVINLAPNDYTIGFADVRAPLRFSVPDTNIVLNVLTLISTGLSSVKPVTIGTVPENVITNNAQDVSIGLATSATLPDSMVNDTRLIPVLTGLEGGQITKTQFGISNGTTLYGPSSIISGNINAATFTGNGNALTNLRANQLTGTLSTAQLPSGVVTILTSTNNWGKSLKGDYLAVGAESVIPFNGRSLNEWALPNWRLALQRTNAIRLMFVGDSTSMLQAGSRAYGIKSYFKEYLPNVQKAYLTPYNYANSAGLVLNGDNTNWFTQYLQMPSGSFSTNDGGYGAGAVLADTIKFAGIAWPHGGTVKVYSLTTPTTPTLQATISLSNSVTSGFFTNITITPCTCYVAVESTTVDPGYSNMVLFCVSEQTTSKNLIVYDMGYGGRSVMDWVNVPTNIFYPVWKGLSNDVIIVSQRNSTGTIVSNNIGQFVSMFTNASPNSDMIWLSAITLWAPGWDVDGINRQFYANARATGQFYFDDNSQLPSTNLIAAMGLSVDGIHLTTLGATIAGGMLAREMKRAAEGYDWSVWKKLAVLQVPSIIGPTAFDTMAVFNGQSFGQNISLNNTANGQTLIAYNVRGSGYNSWRVGATDGTGNSPGSNPNFGILPISSGGGYALGGNHLAAEFGTNGDAWFTATVTANQFTGNGTGITNLNTASLRVTNFPVNGYALRYTNGNLYWAP